ncbi:GSU3529 family protein [Trichloromonas sp.]|uniref:GSU3529 family protein n=1 Tax=Trichloromonas sp. TaxID=3069249 RepID=UPI002A3E1B49|nr:hypothetical protein [Trichloromonas sp.]
MELFAKLRAVTEAARRDQDLPDPLAAKIFAILDNPELFRAREKEIRDLIGQVNDYDTYCQIGYMGMGVNNAILEGTLNRLWA